MSKRKLYLGNPLPVLQNYFFLPVPVYATIAKCENEQTITLFRKPLTSELIFSVPVYATKPLGQGG
jgi:hypothetical protein